MTTFDKDSVIEALRLRYDYYSASSMFEVAREKAGLPDKPAFDATELRAFRNALSAVGDRVASVLAQLDGWLDNSTEEPTRPEPKPTKPEPKQEAKPEPKQDSKPQPKQETKPQAKQETKPESKPDAKQAEPAETTIIVTGVPAEEGEEVLVCGGDENLGDWDPARARPLARKGAVWMTTIKLAPDARVPFKFLKRTAGGEVIWEDGDDRDLVAKQPVEATWRQ